MRRLTATLFSALLAAAPSAGVLAKDRRPPVSAAGTPLPGWWRYDTSFLFSDSTEMKCIAAADVDKVLKGPANRHYDCTYPVREVADGRARFEGSCVNRKNGQTADVALRGSYSPTRFEFHGTVKANMGMLSLPLNASISAERVGATCPAT